LFGREKKKVPGRAKDLMLWRSPGREGGKKNDQELVDEEKSLFILVRGRFPPVGEEQRSLSLPPLFSAQSGVQRGGFSLPSRLPHALALCVRAEKAF